MCTMERRLSRKLMFNPDLHMVKRLVRGAHQPFYHMEIRIKHQLS